MASKTSYQDTFDYYGTRCPSLKEYSVKETTKIAYTIAAYFENGHFIESLSLSHCIQSVIRYSPKVLPYFNDEELLYIFVQINQSIDKGRGIMTLFTADLEFRLLLPKKFLAAYILALEITLS